MKDKCVFLLLAICCELSITACGTGEEWMVGVSKGGTGAGGGATTTSSMPPSVNNNPPPVSSGSASPSLPSSVDASQAPPDTGEAPVPKLTRMLSWFLADPVTDIPLDFYTPSSGNDPSLRSAQSDLLQDAPSATMTPSQTWNCRGMTQKLYLVQLLAQSSSGGFPTLGIILESTNRRTGQVTEAYSSCPGKVILHATSSNEVLNMVSPSNNTCHSEIYNYPPYDNVNPSSLTKVTSIFVPTTNLNNYTLSIKQNFLPSTDDSLYASSGDKCDEISVALKLK